MASVFISHSSRDNEAAARIKTWLRDQGFDAPFLDFDKHAGIPPGADWEQTLYREIELSEAVVIIQTSNWLDSKWCFAEFTQARALGKAIFPIIEGSNSNTLISPDIQALDLRTDREGGLERLARQLRQIALDAQGGFIWDSRRPPYPGLLAFQEEDAAVYFGRDDDVRRLIEKLDALRAHGGAKLVALLGASGSGKSSLLRAGVIPRLKRSGRNWIVVPTMRPQVRPVDELARALAVAAGQGTDWRKLNSDLLGSDPARFLNDFATELRIKAGANEAQILIAVDQAEELFGAADPDHARCFLEILSRAMTENIPLITVMALRSDYLGTLQSAHHLSARFEGFSLGPMPLARIAQIIQGPARVAGLTIDEGLVLQAVRDAETEDALPLLAFALRELYDRSGGDNHLDLGKYNALGDPRAGLGPLENSVRRAADGVLDRARPLEEELAALREAFVPAMVRVNDQGDYVRRPAVWNELPANSYRLLEGLALARLLIIRQDDDVRVVEVAHEALLRKWPLLRSWLDDAREFLIGKQHMDQDVQDWERATEANKSSALLTGLKLDRARAWLSERPHQLTAQERAFIRSSIDFAEANALAKLRQRRNISRATVTAAAVLAVVASLAAFQWRKADAQRLIADARRLAIDSQLELQQHFDLSLLLANASIESSPTWEARNSVLTGILSHPHLSTFLTGHKSAVTGVAFSPDGTILASASWDKTVILWDVAARKPLGEPLTGHKAEVSSVAFSRNGTLASASLDGTVILWDVAARKPLGEPLTGPDNVGGSLAFSPDGKTLAAANQTSVILWDVAARKPLGEPLTGPGGSVKRVAFSPDGKTLAWQHLEGHVILWDVAAHKPLGEPRGAAAPFSFAFSPDGKTLALGNQIGGVTLWDVAARKPLGELFPGHKGAVVSVAFTQDGRMLASGSIDNTVILWNVAERERLAEPTLVGHAGPVSSVAFSPDGEMLASASGDGTVILWGRATQKPLGEILSGDDHSVESVAFSPDGQTLAWGTSSTTIMWDVAARKPVGEPLTSHKGNIVSVAFSPNGKLLATGSYDKTVQDGFVILWDVAARKPVGEPLTGHKGEVSSVAFSPNGKTLASASRDTVILWDVAARKPVGDLLTNHKGEILSVAFSPDGRTLASGSGDYIGNDSFVILWDVGTRKPLGEPLTGTGQVRSVAFSPDGKILASASWGGTGILWDVTARKPVGEPFTSQKGHILSVAFSADGKTLAWGGSDEFGNPYLGETAGKGEGWVVLWDVTSHKPLSERLANPYDTINSVAFSPDGKTLASGGRRGTILWDLTGKGWQERACAIANRNFTCEEWHSHMRDQPYRKVCDRLPGPACQ